MPIYEFNKKHARVMEILKIGKRRFDLERSGEEPKYEFNKEYTQVMEILKIGKRRFDLERSGKDPKKKKFSPRSGFWTINDVKFWGQSYRVDLSKKLLDNGTQKTQDEWIDYSKKSQERNDFYVGDFSIYHFLFASLYKLKDEDNPEIEEIREFLDEQLNHNLLMTLTRIKHFKRHNKNDDVMYVKPIGYVKIPYSPPQDRIIHNYKMFDDFEFTNNYIFDFRGDWVKDAKDKDPYKVLLGTNGINLRKLNSIYNWMTEKDVFLNTDFSYGETDFVVRFGIDKNLDYIGKRPFCFNCNGRESSSKSPAIGIRLVSQET